MIRYIIIDPDINARKALVLQLSKCEEFSVTGLYDRPSDLPFEIDRSNIDVLFVEAAYKGENWLHFVRSLQHSPLVVICTIYRDYAVECYELDIVDYLVKPVQDARLDKTVHKIQTLLGSKSSTPNPENEYIFIKADKRKIKLLFQDIIFVESLKDYICIHTPTEQFVIHHTLSNFTKGLPSDRFIRIHRSYTVSLDKVSSMIGSSIQISGQSLPIGRNYIAQVREMILTPKHTK